MSVVVTHHQHPIITRLQVRFPNLYILLKFSFLQLMLTSGPECYTDMRVGHIYDLLHVIDRPTKHDYEVLFKQTLDNTLTSTNIWIIVQIFKSE